MPTWSIQPHLHLWSRVGGGPSCHRLVPLGHCFYSPSTVGGFRGVYDTEVLLWGLECSHWGFTTLPSLLSQGLAMPLVVIYNNHVEMSISHKLPLLSRMAPTTSCPVVLLGVGLWVLRVCITWVSSCESYVAIATTPISRHTRMRCPVSLGCADVHGEVPL